MSEQKTAKGPSAVSASVAELMSVAAAVAAGFEAGIEYHVTAGRKAGVSDEDLILAVNVGLKLRQASMQQSVSAAQELLAPGEKGHEHGGCGCGHGDCKD